MAEETPTRAVRADRRRNDDAISAAAARVLSRDPTASVQAVADEAGVARLTVYRRFPSREALQARVREATIRDVTEALDRFSGWDEGLDALRDLLGDLLTVSRTYPAELSRHRLSTPSPIDRRMTALLAEGQDAGLLRTDVDASLLNAVVIGILGAACDATAPEDAVPSSVVVGMVLGAVGAFGTGNRPGG